MNKPISIKEIFLPIDNYEFLYSISNFGNVKSFYKNKNGKLLKPQINHEGYYRVRLYKNKKWIQFFIHKLVIETFEIKKILIIDHINSIRIDNRLLNLRYCTSRENSIFMAERLKSKSSNFVGVSYCKQTNKWRSHITINDKFIHLGRFNTQEEARYAYEYALNNI